MHWKSAPIPAVTFNPLNSIVDENADRFHPKFKYHP